MEGNRQYKKERKRRDKDNVGWDGTTRKQDSCEDRQVEGTTINKGQWNFHKLAAINQQPPIYNLLYLPTNFLKLEYPGPFLIILQPMTRL